GTIRQIRNAPQMNQNVVTYDAVIDVDNSGLELKPGMTANVSVVYYEKAEALRVPNAALRFRPPPKLVGSSGGADENRAGDRRTVWIARSGRLVPRSVHLIASDGTWTEIQTGDLAEGDEVVTDVLGGKNKEDKQAHSGNPFKRYF